LPIIACEKCRNLEKWRPRDRKEVGRETERDGETGRERGEERLTGKEHGGLKKQTRKYEEKVGRERVEE
jgi:hypothetical protein